MKTKVAGDEQDLPSLHPPSSGIVSPLFPAPHVPPLHLSPPAPPHAFVRRCETASAKQWLPILRNNGQQRDIAGVKWGNLAIFHV
ncbi:hypothetical protein Nepgr_016506 [Nepenthes gracilis]|uniref:Uncharacterized protein n=1 Tax=Nepenthes gracilis TaxID=150966 RepID=A0AAD3SPV3_NEPGR|nr:hypothetical protein Nepgr_016506 [Nepenthes gracilis]